jgi:hypothetical protein
VGREKRRRGKMKQDYVHQKLGQDIQSISGTYTPQKELKLEHNGKPVLCVIGMAVVDTACCGPGYVVTWKDRQNESGLAVSQVESIEDEKARQAVQKILRDTENINNFNFL